MKIPSILTSSIPLVTPETGKINNPKLGHGILHGGFAKGLSGRLLSTPHPNSSNKSTSCADQIPHDRGWGSIKSLLLSTRVKTEML